MKVDYVANRWWVLSPAGNLLARFTSKTEAEMYLDEMEDQLV